MRITNFDNDKTLFLSKIRIQPNLMYNVSMHDLHEKSLLKSIKKLENNGNDDIVVLSLKTIEDETSYIDYICMDVFEKRAGGLYTNEDTIESIINTETFNGNNFNNFCLNKMYNEAKGKMTKLVNKMNNYLQYL